MNLQGFHFADPNWLYSIFFLPLALLLFFLTTRLKHTTLYIGNPRLVEMGSGTLTAQWLPWVLRFLVLLLCLIAAARPQAGQKKVETKTQATDLFVALDVSGSMVTNDLQPNRITAAKKLLSEFLDKVQNVRVGLTIFARISFTQCPLTTDISIVKQLLANVEPAPHSIKLDGTAIGDALVSCLNRLQQGTGKGTPTPTSAAASLASKLLGTETSSEEPAKNTQAILLLTDGGNNAGMVDPLTAAKIAVSRGIKVYTVGMGAKNRVLAMGEYPDGHVGPYIDPRTGEMALSDPVDMGLLTEIARITGGKAYAATDNRSLQAILDDVARLEKHDVVTVTHWEYNELAAYFLLGAFILLLFDMGLEMTVLRTLP